MRVGVLTGGGDCPGLNAVIRAVVRKGIQVYGYEFVGFRDGWRGPLEGDTLPLDVQAVRGILPRGGTILGSSRTNPIKIEGGVERIKDNLAGLGVDALFDDVDVIEGQGTAGLEIAEQLGHATARVIIPCGGGGLASGIALALPESAIVVAEPAGWDDPRERARSATSSRSSSPRATRAWRRPPISRARAASSAT